MFSKIPAFAAILFLFSPLSAFALNSVTVMADSSLSIPISEIARSYSLDKNIVVNTSFTPQKTQETQITEGAAADILITPQQAWIGDLKMRGLVDVYSQTPVAGNRLVLAGPRDSPLKVTLSQKFPVADIVREIGAEPGFVIGNPETLPEGGAAKEALRNLGVASDLEPYTLYIKRQDEMLDMITSHKAYGIFFASDIAGHADVKILDYLPPSSYTPVEYYAVVIAGDNMDAARRFLDYLTSQTARRILEANGLTIN